MALPEPPFLSHGVAVVLDRNDFGGIAPPEVNNGVLPLPLGLGPDRLGSPLPGQDIAGRVALFPQAGGAATRPLRFPQPAEFGLRPVQRPAFRRPTQRFFSLTAIMGEAGNEMAVRPHPGSARVVVRAAEAGGCLGGTSGAIRFQGSAGFGREWDARPTAATAPCAHCWLDRSSRIGHSQW